MKLPHIGEYVVCCKDYKITDERDRKNSFFRKGETHIINSVYYDEKINIQYDYQYGFAEEFTKEKFFEIFDNQSLRKEKLEKIFNSKKSPYICNTT